MNTRKHHTNVQTIGILSGLELVGDALAKLPFLRALRATWPTAHISWITTKGPTAYNSLLRETTRGLVDKIEEMPDWLHKEKNNAPHFDLLIDTRGRWKLALQARLCIPHSHFIAPAFHYLFSDIRPAWRQPMPERMIERLLQTITLFTGAPPKVTGRLPIPKALLDTAHKILPHGQILIGFAPGAGNPIKKWPIHSFTEVAKIQARLGRCPVFLLGPQEADLMAHLRLILPQALFPLQNELWGTQSPTVDQTLAIGACLNVALTNDSGTSHMLAAVDCPLVSLFGPTSAEKLAPKVTYGKIIKSQMFGGDDMSLITKESVLSAIDEVLLLQK